MSESTSPDAVRAGQRELELLDAMASVLSEIGEPEAVLERVMDLFLMAMGGAGGQLLRFGPTGIAEPLVVRNLSPDAALGMAATWSRRALEMMDKAGELVFSQDVLNDHRFRHAESILAHQIQALLCIPIAVRGETTGAVYIDHRTPGRTFGPRDVVFARALAALVGVVLERADAIQALHVERDQLRERAAKFQYGDLIGASKVMQELFARLHRAAQAPEALSILLLGEPGVGKSAVAKLLHREGTRRDGPFVSFDAGHGPATLIEAELFGYRRGSFTGATDDRDGLIKQAEGGVLFLDDVDALPLEVQPKLLTFLQERRYRPLGLETRTADVRVLCATNADLASLVREGRFRRDLLDRLDGVVLDVPPLRQRNEDILLLAHRFLFEFAEAVAHPVHGFDDDAVAAMMAYPWPANVRELRHEVAQAVTMTDGPLIGLKDFKKRELREVLKAPTPPPEAEPIDLDLDTAHNAVTFRILSRALALHDNNLTRAAKAVGISRARLYDLAEQVGIKVAPRKPGRPRNKPT